MIDFMKSLLPNFILLLAFILDTFAKKLADVSFKIHVAFGTKLGSNLLEIKKRAEKMQELMQQYDTTMTKAAKTTSPTAQKKANPKLYNILTAEQEKDEKSKNKN